MLCNLANFIYLARMIWKEEISTWIWIFRYMNV